MKNILGGTIGVGKKPHSTKSRRKIITIQEWADYLGVNRNTILAHLKKYRLLAAPTKFEVECATSETQILVARAAP